MAIHIVIEKVTNSVYQTSALSINLFMIDLVDRSEFQGVLVQNMWGSILQYAYMILQ